MAARTTRRETHRGTRLRVDGGPHSQQLDRCVGAWDGGVLAGGACSAQSMRAERERKAKAGVDIQRAAA